MAGAVNPVIEKIVEHQGGDPGQRIFQVPGKSTKPIHDDGVHQQSDYAANRVDELAHHADVERGDGILKTIKLQSSPVGNPHFNGDEKKEEGDEVKNWAHEAL